MNLQQYAVTRKDENSKCTDPECYNAEWLVSSDSLLFLSTDPSPPSYLSSKDWLTRHLQLFEP